MPSFYVYGDTLVDSEAAIRRLQSLLLQSPTVENCTHGCLHQVRTAVARLASAERAIFQNFTTFHHLFRLSHPIPRAVALCLLQFNESIYWAERNPAIFAQHESRGSVGLGFGMVPAAAFTCASAPVQLAEVAPPLVLLVLDLALAAHHRADTIETSTQESWAFRINGISEHACKIAISEYLDSKKQLPPYKRPYISEIASSSVVVSGPPSVVEDILSTNAEQWKGKTCSTPQSAAYHAPHLPFPSRPINSHLPVNGNLPVAQNAFMVSSSTGDTLDRQVTLEDLLRIAIEEILQCKADLRATNRLFEPTSTARVLTFGRREDSRGWESRRQDDTIFVFTDSDDSSRIQDDYDRNSIAVVGMAGRFPGADDLDSFWELLQTARETHEKVPSDRFDLTTHYDPSAKTPNTTQTPWGCFIAQPGLFDNAFFRMSPREATQTDPIHRLLLLTTYEALEEAGYTPGRTKSSQRSRIGTFFGQTSDDYREVNAGQKVDAFFTPGGVRAFGPGRLNYFFKWEGPAYSLDAACSSSFAAIETAIANLKSGAIDMAIAGGANIMTNSDMFAGLCRGGFLSMTGGCQTFTSDANGYCRGDAVATVVLKRLEDAIADNDDIQAVIPSIISNHSVDNASITQPHAPTQEALFRQVLQASRTMPHQVDYVEMHGTGTQIGDKTEATSVASVFLEQRDKREHPLFVGSLKPNIGHTEAASGVASLIKSILMLRSDKIPPHINVRGRLNPTLPPGFDRLIPQTLTQMRPRHQDQPTRNILVNNFDACGGNTSLLVRDPPRLPSKDEDPRTTHVVALSAKSSKSLLGNVSNLRSYLDKNPQVRLCDVAYTTTARRSHYKYRKAYAVSSKADLVHALSTDGTQKLDAINLSKAKPIVFAFTGQGAIYKSMGKELYAFSSTVRGSLSSSSAICERLGFPPIVDVFDGSPSSIDLESEKPIKTHLAILALEIALASLWNSFCIKATIVIGHSLGEYAALCTAGVLTVADALFLAGTRARLLEQHCTLNEYSMLIIERPVEEVRQSIATLSYPCEIACVNGPKATVIAGLTEHITEFHNNAKSQGWATTPMPLPYAFHSSQMDVILNEFTSATENISFHPPKLPIASTCLGRIIPVGESINRDYLVRQVRSPVLFETAILAARQSGYIGQASTYIEVGPAPLCLSMIRSTLGSLGGSYLPSLKRDASDIRILSNSIVRAYEIGHQIDFSAIHSEYEGNLSSVRLPSYAFDLETYWLQYEGQWMIQKNQASPPSSLETPSSSSSSSSLSNAIVPAAQVPRLNLCGSITQYLDNISDVGQGRIVFATDFSDERLRSLVLGHSVNGNALCSASLWADVAYTAAMNTRRILGVHNADEDLEMCDMAVPKPFILDPVKAEVLITTVTYNRESGHCDVEFTSGADVHARCTLTGSHKELWQSSWASNAYLVRCRMDQLRSSLQAHQVDRLNRRTIYRLFSNIVTYSEMYQGLDELHLDGRNCEAVGQVKLKAPASEAGRYYHDPHAIDSFLHISGFVVNGNAALDEDQVHIAHGWHRLRIAEPFDTEAVYESYVRMRPEGSHGLMIGDVWLFRDAAVMAVCEGVMFKAMKRKMLHKLLPMPAAKSSAHSVSKKPLSSIQEETWKDGGSDAPKVPPPTATATATETVPSLETTNATPTTQTQMTAPLDVLRSGLSEELGMEAGKIGPDTDLVDLGVDSLISMMVLDRLRKETALDLPANLLQTYSSLGELATFLDKQMMSLSSRGSEQPPRLRTAIPQPPASTPGLCILIQTATTANAAKLFLLPDGSGSAGAYANISTIHSRYNVYALNSPFKSSPSSYSSIEQITKVFVDEIRAEQPHGPYNLGGWSIGGTYAYEVAQLLLRANETVESMILIDAPCFATIRPMNGAINQTLKNAGAFDGTSDAVKAHFDATVLASLGYQMQAMPKATGIRVKLIWAGDAIGVALRCDKKARVVDTVMDAEAHEWLDKTLQQRHLQSGWQGMMSGARFEEAVIWGDHFSVMQPPFVDALCQEMRAALK